MRIHRSNSGEDSQAGIGSLTRGEREKLERVRAALLAKSAAIDHRIAEQDSVDRHLGHAVAQLEGRLLRQRDDSFLSRRAGPNQIWRQRLDVTTTWAITSTTSIITVAFSFSAVPHIVFSSI